jgi:hypothetical protein
MRRPFSREILRIPSALFAERDRSQISCQRICEALSARLDGERSLLGPEQIEDHLGRCRRCREFESSSAELARRVAMRAARPAPPSLVGHLVSGLDGPVSGRLSGHDGLEGTSAQRPRTRAKWVAAVAPVAVAVSALPLGLSIHPKVTPTHVRTPCTIWLHPRELR